jgi:ABC-2 type transport system permease protein
MTGWSTVTRKEIRGVLGSRIGKAGVGLVVFVFVLGGYVTPTVTHDPTLADYDGFLRGVVLFVVPLFGLLLGYRTVVAERVTGSLILTLSVPHSRADVVLGKAVGRGFVLVSTIAVGVCLGAGLVAYPFGSVSLGRLASYFLSTTLFGLAFLAVGIGLSTLTASLRRATVFSFGVFFLAVVAWPQLDGLFLAGLEYANLADDDLPNWAVFLYGIEPGMLYRRVLDTFVSPNRLRSGTYLGVGRPWYLQGGLAAVLLLGWSIIPTLAGYLRFRRTDL